MDKVVRPIASKGKIHCRNEFELCYLRHQYLRRVDYNPTKKDMEPYKAIAAHMARNTFFTYRNLFHLIGFESEDLINIANVHIVSFLGLFSLEKLPEKYQEFFKSFDAIHKEGPQSEDILNKNKANCTLFLKQRMEDVVRICRQKAHNIKGYPTEEHYFYSGSNPPPALLRDLIDKHEKLGYKKLSTAVYKSIKKKVHPVLTDGPVFEFNQHYYVAVPIDQKNLSLDDFSGAGLDPHDNLHNKTPEEICSLSQENEDLEQKEEEFFASSDEVKTKLIKRFIRKNKRNPLYKEEMRAARKMLREIEAQSCSQTLS